MIKNLWLDMSIFDMSSYFLCEIKSRTCVLKVIDMSKKSRYYGIVGRELVKVPQQLYIFMGDDKIHENLQTFQIW